MIWEGQSSLIIMLTTIVERGRIKCHNYWPEVGETVVYGRLSVTCTKEDSRQNFVFRDFSIRHLDRSKRRKASGGSGEPEKEDEGGDAAVADGGDGEEEVRHVTQMAYLSWPDHGVPENPDEFVQVPILLISDSAEKIRQKISLNYAHYFIRNLATDKY
jgi:tyrosine-protein phosphatase non-receptor type 4